MSSSDEVIVDLDAVGEAGQDPKAEPVEPPRPQLSYGCPSVTIRGVRERIYAILFLIAWLVACILIFAASPTITQENANDAATLWPWTWGIVPRTARGLIGIFFAPLIHAGRFPTQRRFLSFRRCEYLLVFSVDCTFIPSCDSDKIRLV